MILVAGPPCGGKTTYARSLGGVILDYDDVVEELGAQRYEATPEQLAQAGRTWLERLPEAEVVVWTAPRRVQRGRFRSQYRARVVVVLASPQECHRRADESRPDAWHGAIDRWFVQWEPSRSGREVLVRTDVAISHSNST